jgi:two-component system chemotaxis sensor kinase CheA
MGLDPEFLKQLVETFNNELAELLQVIINGLLELEKSDQDAESHYKSIATIFRAAHNIKGSAGSLGVNNVSDIAHGIESIFSALQKDNLVISKEIVDICLEAVDKMQIAMTAYVQQTELPFDMSNFLQRMGKVQPIIASNPDASNTAASITPSPAPSPVSDKPAALIEKVAVSKSMHTEKNATTMRVSVHNVDHISSLMEEMQINKIAIDDYYAELTKLAIKSKQFQDIWKKTLSYTQHHTNADSKDRFTKTAQMGSDICLDMNNALAILQKNMRSQLNQFTIISNSIQDEMRILRLVPAANLLDILPRYVRDLSRDLNKKVSLKISGGEVKVDKMILESIKDPIIHLIRNCIDHGIGNPKERKAVGKSEEGTINIDISEDNSQIIIHISDDGRGIDRKKIAQTAINKNIVSQAELDNMSEEQILNLIFQSGFSTKDIITDVSGRGVGLDVVKTNINNLNGTVKINTRVGKGTTFDLHIPLTLASERGLLINCCGQLFIVPAHAVTHILIITSKDIVEVTGKQAIILENHPILLHSLAPILGLEEKLLNEKQLSIIVLKKEPYTVAFLVDEIVGEREIVIKPLQQLLKNTTYVSGGTLSGSNQVIVVLNASAIINAVINDRKTTPLIFQNTAVQTVQKPHILVVDDSITTRMLEKNILESKNYQVTVAVNGKEAWDMLQTQAFSLMITDISMPIMDGFTLTEHVKKDEKLRHMPIIIVTSLGSDNEKKRGVEVGADAYIVKNEFESGSLLNIVKQLMPT